MRNPEESITLRINRFYNAAAPLWAVAQLSYGRRYEMEPGEGAVEYAKSLTEGLTREEAASIIHTIMIGPFEDPRVKWCVVCGYPFRDVTRPGNAKVCGPTCKTMQKTAQRRKQRKVKPGRNITIKTNEPIRYLGGWSIRIGRRNVGC